MTLMEAAGKSTPDFYSWYPQRHYRTVHFTLTSDDQFTWTEEGCNRFHGD